MYNNIHTYLQLHRDAYKKIGNKIVCELMYSAGVSYKPLTHVFVEESHCMPGGQYGHSVSLVSTKKLSKKM